MKKFHISLFLLILFLASLSYAQPTKILNSSEIQLALKKLNVLGSVLYIAAHPDDENTADLAYFAKGRCYRTGYLALTRGDGGQNLIGSEKGDAIGVIRTHELLEARKVDGAEQFFTRAVDFGFTKSPDEALSIWGHDKILSDVVWVIRKFRPDVIITRFPPSGVQTHGHHTASAILAIEAFKISGDSTKFPEQLKYVKPWKAKRIVWNNWGARFGQKFATDGLVKIDIGSYNTLLGKSYTEISAISRSNHQSQGFGDKGDRGTDWDYFSPLGGDTAKNDLFEGINTAWSRVDGSEKVASLLKVAYDNFTPENPSATVPILLRALTEMDKLPDGYWVNLKKKEVNNLIQSCLGLWVEAVSDDFSVAPGDSIKLDYEVINRSNIPIELKSVNLPYGNAGVSFNKKLTDNNDFTSSSKIKIPDDADYTQPYWLKNEHNNGAFVVNDQTLIGYPRMPAKLTATFTVNVNGQELQFDTPILYRWIDRVRGELYRSLEIRPAVTVNFDDKVFLFPDEKSKNIRVTIKSDTDNLSGKLKLDLPKGWKSDPEAVNFNLAKKYDEQKIIFKVTPSSTSSVGDVVGEATVNGKVISKSLVEINHSHIPRVTLFPEAKAKVIRLDIKKVISKIGYIMGSGDEVPNSLRQLGYNVTELTDEELETGNLSQYDAIIAGIRVYNVNPRIKFAQARLMNYVKNGGTYLVQYNVNYGLQLSDIGPYPFKLSRDRVTVEDAPVTFLDKGNVFLNKPNKITEDDFKDWVQERGLYFSNDWSTEYTPLFACNDPGENSLKGGTLVAHYGKGVFIYSGYSWFRQLPAGVPGAYRIFVNLISGGK